jgi:hypothetical protein
MRSHLLAICTVMLAVVLGIFGGQKKKTISPEKATKNLFQAVIARDPKLVLLAIQNKADVNAKDERGWTPLLYACYSSKENFEIAQILIRAGANVTVGIPFSGHNCLDFALSNRNLKLADLGITHGIPISEQNRRQYESILANGTINPQLEFLGLFYRDPMTFQQQLTKKNDTELQELKKTAQWYDCSEPLMRIQALTLNKFQSRLHDLLKMGHKVDSEITE